MKYREYGSTGKFVSEIGMGTSRLSGGQEKFNENVMLVEKAIELGINYFDTAPTYASGLSEKILGEAFKNANRKVYVTSKSMVTMEGTADEVLWRIEKSIKTLGVEKIDFFHMWSILDRNQYLRIISKGGPLEGAIRAKEVGMIDHICFSAHCNGDVVEEILQNSVFDGVTLGFNAINYKHKLQGVQYAGEKNLGVAIMNPLGGGLIPRNPDYFKYICVDEQNVVEAAIKFVLGHHTVSTVLIGAENERELLQACEISDRTEDYKLDKRYEAIAVYDNLAMPLCTMCNYCDGCPQGIKINYQMGSYNELILSNRNIEHFNQWKKMYFNAYPFEKIECIKCGKCERKCTQHIPIIKRIDEINSISRVSQKIYLEKCKSLFENSDKKKTAIWGMTYEAESILAANMLFFGSLPPNLYLIDGNEAKWNKEFAETGLMIHSPEILKEVELDRIIIASKKYENEIRKKILEFAGGDCDIICI